MKLNINFKRIRNIDCRVDGLMLFKGIGNFLCLDTHLKGGNTFFQNGCHDAYDSLKIPCFSEENYVLLQLLLLLLPVISYGINLLQVRYCGTFALITEFMV